MGLSHRGELVNTLSNPDANQIVTDRVSDTKDTFTNRTSIAPERYNSIYGTLIGYGEGSPIVVEYYNRKNPITNKQTSEIDISSVRHSVHSDYLLIHYFEIRLEGQLEMTYDEDNNVMEIIGVGLTYPGFEPNIGDVFLYELPDTQIGYFGVSSVKRLSINQGTYHKIEFYLYKWADDVDLEKLNTSVNDEVYFDKQKYLSNNATLLKSVEYTQLNILKRYRKVLIEYYFQTFFNISFQSIMTPEGVYDPYIVEFLNNKVSLMDIKDRPRQLYPAVEDYYSSIWFLLSTAEHNDVTALVYKTFTIQNQQSLWDAGITALINCPYIHLDDSASMNIRTDKLLIIGDEDDTYYVFSEAFYLGDADNMSDIELMLYTAINTNSVDIDTFITTYLNNFRLLSKTKQFYTLCAYLYLIDISIASIT